MSALDFLLPWDSQPQEAVGVDWSNPLTRELLVSLPLSAPTYTSIGRNPITGTPTAASVGATPKGTALKLAATGQIALGTACLLPTSTTPFTLTLYELPDATSAFSSLVGLSGGTRQWLWIRGTNIEYFCSVGRSNAAGATQHFNSVGAQVAGVGHRFLITGSGGVEGTAGTYRLWMDGVEQSSELKTFGSVASGTNYIGWDGADTKFNGKLQDFNLWGRILSDAEIAEYFAAPWQLFAPRSIWVPVSAGGGSTAALTGTATTATEADIVAGGETIILTLTGDTWVTAGATFDAQRANIIAGLDSAQSELLGWDNVVKALQGVSGVVRTSDTVCTITLDAQATYSITADETITATIPATALTGGVAIVAAPTFDVTEGAGVTFNPAWARNANTLLIGGRL